MTKEELKKKIVNILNFVDTSAALTTLDMNFIADALIEAELKFDDMTEAERQRYNSYEIIEPQIKGCLDREKNLEKRLAEAEHRAARAERALKSACYDKARTYFPNVPNDEYENRMDEYYREYVEKSEKELAEGKEENNAKNQRE